MSNRQEISNYLSKDDIPDEDLRKVLSAVLQHLDLLVYKTSWDGDDDRWYDVHKRREWER